MSENITKTAIRLPLPELDGKTTRERVEFLKTILGEPDEIEEFDGDIDYFSYKGYKFVRTYKDNRFAVDLILSEGNSWEHNGLFMQIGELQEKSNLFAKKFGHNGEECVIVALTYYNGSDEPIQF